MDCPFDIRLLFFANFKLCHIFTVRVLLQTGESDAFGTVQK